MPLFHLRASQLYASVCNDVALGFLSTWLVAVAVPFPFVRGSCVIPTCKRGLSSEVAHRVLLFAEGRVFRCRGCGGDLLPEGFGLLSPLLWVVLGVLWCGSQLCCGRLLAVQDALLSLCGLAGSLPLL